MARVEREDSWTTTLTSEQAGAALAAFFSGEGMELTASGPAHFEAKQGSQLKMRLLGGWFVNERVLPKMATADVSATGGRSSVSVHLADTFGFGVPDPKLRGKYATCFEGLLSRLKAAIPPEA